MKFVLRWTLSMLLLSAVAFSFPVWAQQGTAVTGGLNGVVTDSSGAVVPGATIVLSGPQGTRTLTTDNQGRYSATGLTPGYYNVSVEKPGFEKLVSNHDEVVVGISSLLNLTLTIGNVAQTVEVNASAVSIDTESTKVST